jgi:uncharacterized membrane protein
MVEHIVRRGRIETPLFGILLGGVLPLSLGGLLSDWGYYRTYQIQWINFADWLVAGSLVFAGLALAWAVIGNFVRRRWGQRLSLITALALLLFFIVQFLNALTHSKDAFATMPAGLTFSLVATLIALIATWTGFSSLNDGDAR